MAESKTTTGLFDTVRHMAHTVLRLLQNRLELCAIELQEEKSRQFKLIALAAAGIFCAFMGLVLLTGILVYMCRQHMVSMLSGLCIVYLVSSAVILLSVCKRWKSGGSIFSSTIKEIMKDGEWLKPRT